MDIIKNGLIYKGKNKMLSEFTPKEFETVTVDVSFTPGEKQTWANPGYPPEIEFTAIYVNGEKLENKLSELVIETYGDTWEEDLLNGHYNRNF